MVPSKSDIVKLKQMGLLAQDDTNGQLYFRAQTKIKDAAKLRNVFTITDDVAHIIFPALEGKINIITGLLIINSSTTVDTVWEIRENNAAGTLLWSGAAVKNGGGANQPMAEVYIEQPTTNRAVVLVCKTTGANVIASFLGYSK